MLTKQTITIATVIFTFLHQNFLANERLELLKVIDYKINERTVTYELGLWPVNNVCVLHKGYLYDRDASAE